MLPAMNQLGIGALSLPQLPPSPSGPNPTAPGQFGSMYDRLLTADGAPGGAGLPGLPTQMEVAPLISPVNDLSQPFKASPEFPGAVDPNAMKVPGIGAMADSNATGKNGLGEMFKPFADGLANVNKLQTDASKLAKEAAVGGDVDIHDVMIAGEKASVAMQLTLQVRNKLVEAYQDVMRMQV
jgi:flagellar hook-basal body complex protein FliE